MLKARDGWASAAKGAARNKLDWFVDAAQLSGPNLSVKNPPRAKEALEAVDNAWRDLAVVERERAAAAEKRLGKVHSRIDELEEKLARVRSGAQERVIAEVRRLAAETRERHAQERAEALKPLLAEIRMMGEQAEALFLRCQRLEGWVREAVGSVPETT